MRLLICCRSTDNGTGSTGKDARATVALISISLVVFLLLIVPVRSHAQGFFSLTGANHPELSWSEMETDHFILTYENGLEPVVREAAPIAESVYRIVTGNLKTPLTKKIRIYFSNNDEVKNAFAFSDDYIFVWMRSIIDDQPFTLRASGTSKWLRTVITHEFTHIVIDHATKNWWSLLLPFPSVPSWFNEGMARYMEPDGWTPDVDMALRVAAVSDQLELDASGFLGGTMLYEGGQSMVRYIAATYGDSVLTKIVKYRKGAGYNFEAAVESATGHSLSELYDSWHKTLNVYYNSQFGQKEDIEQVGRVLHQGLQIVLAARLSPDATQIAVLGRRFADEPTKLFVMKNDTSGLAKLVTDELGIQPYLSWSPDGKSILFSKLHFGSYADLTFDLFRCDVESGHLLRLTENQHLEYPDWSPDGKHIVAAEQNLSGSDLVVLNSDGSDKHELTNYRDPNTSVYTPRWSPDGTRVAFSLFAHDGRRDVAVTAPINPNSNAIPAISLLTHDTGSNRYPVWSHDGNEIAYLSYRSGIPNIYETTLSGDNTHAITNIAGNVQPWDWSGDSLLVTSFAARDKVYLYRIGSNRSDVPSAPVELAAHYTAWRTVRWPLITPAEDSMPAVTITGPERYNSLAHIRPLILLPLLGSDFSANGDDGLQFGLFGFLRDDLGKHTILGDVTYGDVSHRFSYEFTYENAQLRPTIVVGLENAYQFKTVLQDNSYYEHDGIYSLGLNWKIPTPDALDQVHVLWVEVSRERLEPWDPIRFKSVVKEHVPIAATLLRLSAKYIFYSPLFQFSIGGFHTDKALGSDLTTTRLRASFAYDLPLGEDARWQFAVLGHITAQEGDELPQDYLGFYKYDQFSGGFNAAELNSRDRLRGIREYLYGNRLAYASLEFRQPDTFFGDLLPLLRPFLPELVVFTEIGSTWYASAPTNNPNAKITPLSGTRWLQTAGVELRSDLGLGASLSGGVAWQLISHAPADLYIRYTLNL